MSNCQFEQVGAHEGHPILRPRDDLFQTRAREFLQRYQPIHSYLHYLANFACNEGWSGQLESDAYCPDEAWQLLATLAYPKQAASPQNFIKMSDLGYATAKQVDIESPWGAIQRKPAGVDAFLVAEQGDGEKSYYMVWMGSDGSPVGYTKA